MAMCGTVADAHPMQWPIELSEWTPSCGQQGAGDASDAACDESFAGLSQTGLPPMPNAVANSASTSVAPTTDRIRPPHGFVVAISSTMPARTALVNDLNQ